MVLPFFLVFPVFGAYFPFSFGGRPRRRPQNVKFRIESDHLREVWLPARVGYWGYIHPQLLFLSPLKLGEVHGTNFWGKRGRKESDEYESRGFTLHGVRDEETRTWYGKIWRRMHGVRFYCVEVPLLVQKPVFPVLFSKHKFCWSGVLPKSGLVFPVLEFGKCHPRKVPIIAQS